LLYFETHATSLDNEARLASGHFDVDLSPVGCQQAEQLGERYADRLLDAVYASDLRRAAETAHIAFSSRRLAIIRDARLRECDYGDLTRSPIDDLERTKARFVDRPFPNGESYRQVARRVGAFLGETPRGRDILVVGHRATWMALEHLLAGRDLAEAVRSPWEWRPGWTYSW
jgi:broad specificity phosphatase PhoE